MRHTSVNQNGLQSSLCCLFMTGTTASQLKNEFLSCYDYICVCLSSTVHKIFYWMIIRPIKMKFTVAKAIFKDIDYVVSSLCNVFLPFLNDKQYLAFCLHYK